VLLVDLDVVHPQALGLAVERLAEPQDADPRALAVLDREDPVALGDRPVRERLGGAPLGARRRGLGFRYMCSRSSAAYAARSRGTYSAISSSRSGRRLVVIPGSAR
jgi:hypothetical protein